MKTKSNEQALKDLIKAHGEKKGREIYEQYTKGRLMK